MPAIRPAPRLRSLAGARLGFLSNKKRNNAALMEALSAAIRARVAIGPSRTWQKSSVYRALPKRTANEILESCDALVAGPGD